MDAFHLLAAVCYVEMDPVAAGLAVHHAAYRWSSAKARLEGAEDIFASASPPGEMMPDRAEFLRLATAAELKTLQQHDRTGRSPGSSRFVEEMEIKVGRTLRPQHPGSKKKRQLNILSPELR